MDYPIETLPREPPKQNGEQSSLRRGLEPGAANGKLRSNCDFASRTTEEPGFQIYRGRLARSLKSIVRGKCILDVQGAVYEPKDRYPRTKTPLHQFLSADNHLAC